MSLLIAIVLYPAGWGAPAVKEVCGESAASFSAGKCEVKWAFFIAVICMADAFILSFLSLLFIERELRSSESTQLRHSKIKENKRRGEENNIVEERTDHVQNNSIRQEENVYSDNVQSETEPTSTTTRRNSVLTTSL